MRLLLIVLLAFTGLSLLAALGPGPDTWISFTDVASSAGLSEPIVYGGVGRQKYVLETSGTGVAVFDYDGDSRPDIFFANGSRLEWTPEQAPSSRFYRNLGDGKFEDVTKAAGLGRSGWGQAACVGDYDNDGWTDLFLTSYGGNALYRNRGDGTFVDVSEKAGIQATGRWNAGCTFVDFNRDGDLDVFVANYLEPRDAARFEPGSRPGCIWLGMPVLCGPLGLGRAENILYRNNGDGTFTDVSAAAGVTGVEGFYCFMPVTLDFNLDGWPDIFVACDQTPNVLLKNNGDGTFADIAIESGVAYDEDGKEQGCMGVGIGDYNRDGYPDLMVTNFSEDTLYENNQDETFTDVTFSAKLGYNAQYLSWGVGLVDLDNDGWKDIFVVSGHVYPEVDGHSSGISYRQAKQVFRNLGNGTFQDLSARAGAAMQVKTASRGAAFEDLDGDGDLDIVIANMNEVPSLLRNEGGDKNHWLILRLEGARSNRSAIGARIRLHSQGRIQTDEVRSASSYYSSNGLRVHFGLGAAKRADRIEISWPSGTQQVIENVAADRVVSIHERKGVLAGSSRADQR